MKVDPNYLVYPTHLISYRHTPRKYLLRRLKTEKEQEQSIPARMGNLGHKICEVFYQEVNIEDAKANAESHFLDIVHQKREELWDYKIPPEKAPILDDALRNFALNNVFNFRQLQNSNKLDQFLPLATEIELKSSKHPIAAIVDKVNKSFNAIDYKFDSLYPEILARSPSSLTPSEQIEYTIYYEKLLIQSVYAAILIEEKYGKLPSQFFFVYLKHLTTNGSRGIIPVSITKEKVERVLSWTNDMLRDIALDVFPKCTTKDPNACSKFHSVCEYKNYCDSITTCFFSI